LSDTGASTNGADQIKCKVCGQVFDTEEDLEAHKSSLNLTIQTEYERLADDWRQVHTVMWGIPNVAVAILAGIVVAAYQPQLEGWPRIVALTAGSILLFALSIEIVEKRVFMNAISARMYFMEKHNHLEPFNIRKLEVTRELNRYNKEMKRHQETDLPYRLFRWSHAREALTWVVFIPAIILTAMAYWEFVKFLEYVWYSYLVGIIPILGTCVLFIAYNMLRTEGKHKCSNCGGPEEPHTKEFHYSDAKHKNGYCLRCECKEFKDSKDKCSNSSCNHVRESHMSKYIPTHCSKCKCKQFTDKEE
jgi:hypothetical protein